MPIKTVASQSQSLQKVCNETGIPSVNTLLLDIGVDTSEITKTRI